MGASNNFYRLAIARHIFRPLHKLFYNSTTAGNLPGAATLALQNPSELTKPLGQVYRLVHEETHPILPQLVVDPSAAAASRRAEFLGMCKGAVSNRN